MIVDVRDARQITAIIDCVNARRNGEFDELVQTMVDGVRNTAIISYDYMEGASDMRPELVQRARRAVPYRGTSAVLPNSDCPWPGVVVRPVE